MEELNKDVAVRKDDTVMAMMVSRQAQEVQAAMVIARRFPRDENEAYKRIMRSCARVGLAEKAEYTYPRGGEKVMGPSIRLAESIAQNWGNIDYGILELENSNGRSEMMAYAWDLETNTRITKVFSVKHQRDTKQGSKALTDGRDIYEATANFGARRVRACILGIIPGDVVEAAVKECRKTIKGDNKTPIEDRIRVMLNRFDKELRVSTEDIEKFLGCNVKAINENDLIRMRGVFQSIEDGMSKPQDYFARDARPAVADPLAKKDDKAPAAGPAAQDAVIVPEKEADPKPNDAKPQDKDAKLRAELKEMHPEASEWELDDMIAARKAAKKGGV